MVIKNLLVLLCILFLQSCCDNPPYLLSKKIYASTSLSKDSLKIGDTLWLYLSFTDKFVNVKGDSTLIKTLRNPFWVNFYEPNNNNSVNEKFVEIVRVGNTLKPYVSYPIYRASNHTYLLYLGYIPRIEGLYSINTQFEMRGISMNSDKCKVDTTVMLLPLFKDKLSATRRIEKKLQPSIDTLAIETSGSFRFVVTR